MISLQGELFVADLYTGYLFLVDLLNSALQYIGNIVYRDKLS